MAKICGHSGSVTIGNTVGGVTEYTFTTTINNPDATGMDSGQYGEYVQGIKRATLTCTGFWDSGDEPPDVKNASLMSFDLKPNAAATYRVVGSCYVDESSVTTNVDDTSTFTINATVNGSWTQTTMFESTLT